MPGQVVVDHISRHMFLCCVVLCCVVLCCVVLCCVVLCCVVLCCVVLCCVVLCCVVLWVTRTWKLLFIFHVPPTFKITKADLIEERANLLYTEQLTRIWLNANKDLGLGVVSIKERNIGIFCDQANHSLHFLDMSCFLLTELSMPLNPM